MSRSRCLVGALLAAAAVVLVVLAAASAQPRVRGRYGGTLYVGLAAGQPDTLDPTTARTLGASTVFSAICRGLYRIDKDLQVVPDLATALPTISKDKLTYTIPLRKGVVFNDGTPFDAQAVVTSYQRHMTLPTSSVASLLSYVDSVTGSGSSTVVFHLKSRYSPLPTVLNLGIMSPAQLAKLGTNFASNPICVGPFMYDNQVVGDSVTVVKSPYYYDKGDVHFDKIVWKIIPDPAGAAAALRAGDIQVLTAIDSTQVAAVEQASNLKVLTQDALSRSLVRVNLGNKNGVGNLPYLNVGTPLASSPKLRQAFEEALDRSTYNKVVWDGLQRPACGWIPFADKAWYEATSVACTPSDPKDARKLVASSGVANPTVHLLVTPAGQRGAQFIQAAEAAVGINVVVDTTDFATSTDRTVAGDYDAYLVTVSGGSPDPGTMFQGFETSGDRNYMGYSSPRLDLVIRNGFKAMSRQARVRLYRVAQQIIQADRPVIVLTHGIQYAGVSSSVKLGTSSNDFLDYIFGQYV